MIALVATRIRSFAHSNLYVAAAVKGIVAAILGLSLMCGCYATVPSFYEAESHEQNLRVYLRGIIPHPGPEALSFYGPVYFSVTSYDLNGDGKSELIVYISGGGWCGSGGCEALILEPVGHSYKEIDRFTLVWLPIYVLPTSTKGWHDLAWRVQGGGIQPGYFAVLKFNGKKYPGNPSMLPRRMNAASVKKVGIPLPLQEQGQRLYGSQRESTVQTR